MSLPLQGQAVDADQLAKEVGQRSRRIREKQGLSQRALAERAGLSRSRIAQVEAGTGNPTLSTLVQMANALECDVGAFFVGVAGAGSKQLRRSVAQQLKAAPAEDIALVDHMLKALRAR